METDATDNARREGRGRLSSIDLLPDEADTDVIWALEALRERKMPQTAILAEFNSRLADRGIKGVSKSSWSRYAVRKAIQFRRLDEVRNMSSELVTSLGADGPDEVTIAVAEMIKLAAFRVLEGDNVGSKEVMELGRAINSAVQAQRASAAHRQKLEERVNTKIEQAVDKTEELAREAGLGPDRIAQIRKEVLGLRI